MRRHLPLNQSETYRSRLLFVWLLCLPSSGSVSPMVLTFLIVLGLMLLLRFVSTDKFIQEYYLFGF